MEKPKNEDIKKSKGEMAEITKETPEKVGEEVIEKAEEDVNRVNSNAENIDGNLSGAESPEVKEIRDENKNVVNEAGKEFNVFKNGVSGNKEEKSKIEKIIDPDEQIEGINHWLTSVEKCTDMATAKLHLEVVEEELAKAKNANIDTGQIANLEERIEKIKKAINSEKIERTKPVNTTREEEINTEPVSPKTEEIIPEPKLEPEPNPETETSETEKIAEDIENEKLAGEIEEEMDKEKFNAETKERLGEWNEKSENEKKEEIKGEKSEIKGRLKDRIMRENASLVEQKDIEEILKNRDELAALREKLNKEVEENIGKNKEMADKIKENIDPNVNLSELNDIEKSEAKDRLSGFLKTTKDVLSGEEIDYLLEASETENDNFGNLFESHEERIIRMEELQEIIKAIEAYKSFMEKFENLTEEQVEQREQMREEVGKLVRWLEWVKEHKTELFLALVAAGVVAGIAAFVMVYGLPAGSIMPASLISKDIILAAKVGAGVVVAGAAIYKYRKGIKKYIRKGLGAAIGAGVVLDAMLDGKKWDGWMEKICGVRVPESARSGKDKK